MACERCIKVDLEKSSKTVLNKQTPEHSSIKGFSTVFGPDLHRHAAHPEVEVVHPLLNSVQQILRPLQLGLQSPNAVHFLIQLCLHLFIQLVKP